MKDHQPRLAPTAVTVRPGVPGVDTVLELADDFCRGRMTTSEFAHQHWSLRQWVLPPTGHPIAPYLDALQRICERYVADPARREPADPEDHEVLAAAASALRAWRDLGGDLRPRWLRKLALGRQRPAGIRRLPSRGRSSASDPVVGLLLDMSTALVRRELTPLRFVWSYGHVHRSLDAKLDESHDALLRDLSWACEDWVPDDMTPDPGDVDSDGLRAAAEQMLEAWAALDAGDR